ncbi:MAG TPA: 2-hydroxymuconate tautomerase [Chloroflexota bacterium]|jgi:4-oxalocrotonate tautomerase|nr:2-hydroxymuconate tautomerase [Chloroflexota bacterium]
MPYVIVEMIEGRTVEQKRAAAKAITDAIVTHLNTTPEATHVIFHEKSRENFAHGGKLLSD